MAKKADIYINDYDVTVKTRSFSRAWVNKIKEEIPSHGRAWDPVDKVWIFHPSWLEVVEEITQEYYDDVVVYEGEYEDGEDEAWKEEKKSKKKKPEEDPDYKYYLQHRQKFWNWVANGMPEHQSSGGGLWGEVRQLLGPEEMKKLYRMLAMKYHPDVTRDNGEKMKAVNILFEKLGVK